MAIKPNEINDVDVRVVNEAEKHIDAQFRNCDWVKQNRQNTETHGVHWEVVLKGELSRGEKTLLCERYLSAGWKACVIKNSSENNERAGLCGVTLYKGAED